MTTTGYHVIVIGARCAAQQTSLAPPPARCHQPVFAEQNVGRMLEAAALAPGPSMLSS